MARGLQVLLPVALEENLVGEKLLGGGVHGGATCWGLPFRFPVDIPGQLETPVQKPPSWAEGRPLAPHLPVLGLSAPVLLCGSACCPEMVSLKDVAVNFPWQEWEDLNDAQRTLYRTFVTNPEESIRLEKGVKPWTVEEAPSQNLSGRDKYVSVSKDPCDIFNKTQSLRRMLEHMGSPLVHNANDYSKHCQCGIDLNFQSCHSQHQRIRKEDEKSTQDHIEESSILFQHHVLHEKLYNCKGYGKATKWGPRLTEHHREKPHKCDEHDKVLYWHPQLTSHLTIHAGEKPTHVLIVVTPSCAVSPFLTSESSYREETLQM
ncbi:zinc finger protein 682-like isoform X1 [Talpa occidentalis]|uniref:zinc finger protein 682-like isoform X1 n=1 Tax=Talpa occidentalis TaxID=50954 RepID=UPI0023FA1B2D|nr:zinc finger protein 682-like isoform X1 [Talpa occidentalis]XP_054553712.1 zinc finger protein 682-like isoform X1 [Talpa occidentalis]